MPLALGAATNDLSGLLQKGLFEEEANRNLEAAAQAYQTVSAQFDKDRKLAATAIFRLGEIYRKQGKTNEAAGQYERIVREFADQDALITLSRQNLAGLNFGSVRSAASNPASNVILSPAARAEQRRLLEEEIKLVEKKLESQKQIMSSGRVSQADILTTQQELLALKRQLVVVADTQFDSSNPAAETVTTDDEEKEIRRIQAMIKNSPDLINAVGEGGFTPLYRAGWAGWLRVAEFLLDNGAAVDAPAISPRKSFDGWTPLIGAANEGHRAMVELLLNRGAGVDAKEGQQGNSPLHIAAKNGFGGVAEVLLAHKANVNSMSKNDTTPLHLAADAGRSAMMELLLRGGAIVDAKDKYNQTPLAYAARDGQPIAVKVLLAAKADPNVQSTFGRTALSYAAGNGHVEIVKLLLEVEADPNAGEKDLPLAMAARSKQLEIADLLLRAGAKPDLAGKTSEQVGAPGQQYSPQPGNSFGPYTPLQIAVAQGDVAMVKLLLRFKADPNAKDPWSANPKALVFYSLADEEMLKAFLAGGADPDSTDDTRKPLILAAAGSSPSRVEPLIAHGANVNVRWQDGLTPLYVSTERNDTKSVELLLNAKADVSAVIAGSFLTALHRAVNNGSGEIADMLLAHGANPNLKDNTGNTPLHWALGIGNRGIGAQKMVELLLSKGADPNLRNNGGLTPLDLAKGRTIAPQPGILVPQPIPTRSLRQPDGSIAPAQPDPAGVAALLRQHGALDDLPNLDRIEVRRPSANYSAIAFQMGTNGWNEFGLLELIALHYGLITTERNAVWGVNNYEMSGFWRGAACQFPDLGRVLIRRPSSAGPQRTEMAVNAAELLDSGDCTRDVKLKPGDIIEIPEADHPVNESWAGLGGAQLSNLLHCVARTVTISIKGTPTTVRLAPQFKLTNIMVGPTERMQELTRGSFMLKSVLAQSRLLRASSNLAHVKVTRRAAAGGKDQEWVLNCASGNDPDLWLRDGDVIEVPDKP